MQPPSARCDVLVSGAIPAEGLLRPPPLSRSPSCWPNTHGPLLKQLLQGDERARLCGLEEQQDGRNLGGRTTSWSGGPCPTGPLPSVLLKSEKQRRTVWTLWSTCGS